LIQYIHLKKMTLTSYTGLQYESFRLKNTEWAAVI